MNLNPFPNGMLEGAVIKEWDESYGIKTDEEQNKWVIKTYTLRKMIKRSIIYKKHMQNTLTSSHRCCNKNIWYTCARKWNVKTATGHDVRSQWIVIIFVLCATHRHKMIHVQMRMLVNE